MKFVLQWDNTKSIKKKLTKEKTIKNLRQIPGVGISLATDLWNIGITKVEDLKGKYNNNTLNVNYIVEPNSKFQIGWMKFFPIIALFAFKLFFLLNSKKTSSKTFTASNSFIIFIIFFSRWDTNRKKKNLEKKFIEIFELII